MTLTLDAAAARRLRFDAHLLGGSDLAPAEVVDRAVALQGQDLPAVLRAIAIRSRPGTTLDDVRAAFDRGELVRGWPVRGTLFATTPAHLATLLRATAARIHRSTVRRRAELGLDDATVAAAGRVLADRLAHGPISRADAVALLADAGIDAAGGRGYHLLLHHSIGGVAHWGPFAPTGEQLLAATPSEVVATAAAADADDALAAVLSSLVATRGPMTADDLLWWTKLPKSTVRGALARADGVREASVDGRPALVAVDAPPTGGPTGVTLVPAFDEWILGYGDRSLVAGAAMQRSLVPVNNGVFRPAVLVDGVVVGTWRPRPQRRDDPRVELVERVPARTRRAIDAAVAAWPHD